LIPTPERSRYANNSKRAFFFPETQEKICAKCEAISHVSNFFKHKQTSDGYHSWCKQCCREGGRRSLEKKYSTFEGRVKTFLRCCRESSKKRGQEFSITADDLCAAWDAQGGICAYTGWEMTTQPNLPNSVSIERIDSGEGYTKENTIFVCNIVNKMKSNFPGEMFYSVCLAVVRYLGDEDGNLAVDFEQ
jgi:hypothetical protein